MSEIDLLGEGCTLYVHRQKGEVLVVGDDDPLDWLEEAEHEGNEAEGANDEWDESRLGIEWVPLLNSWDLDEYRIMKRFALNARPSVRKELLAAISGRGAFRRFRHAVERLRVKEEWQAYRADVLSVRVRDRLEAKGLAFRR